MKVNGRKIGIKIFSYLMVIILCLMITNKAVYTHVHKMPDGSIVYHAHPFHKTDSTSPYATHQHTTLEFFFFENLYIFLPLILLFLAVISVSKRKKYELINVENFINDYKLCLSDRAPPSL